MHVKKHIHRIATYKCILTLYELLETLLFRIILNFRFRSDCEL